MTGPPIDAAAREADLRRRVRRQIKILRVKAAARGKVSPFESAKLRSAFEDVVVAVGLGAPEDLEDPTVTRFDPAHPFDPDARPDPAS